MVRSMDCLRVCHATQQRQRATPSTDRREAAATLAHRTAWQAVARAGAPGAEVRCWSAGTVTAGCVCTRQPRHSATTDRTPSSPLSMCVSSSLSTPWISASPSGARCSSAGGGISTCFSACSSEHCCFGCSWIALRMYGRYDPIAPIATFPRANDPAVFTSSEGLSNAAWRTPWRPATDPRSARRPISPMQSRLKVLPASRSAGGWLVAWRAEARRAGREVRRMRACHRERLSAETARTLHGCSGSRLLQIPHELADCLGDHSWPGRSGDSLPTPQETIVRISRT